nr:hypothetical protein [Tanacetum cinerariifolium]
MLNEVTLEVEEESEVSLELLRENVDYPELIWEDIAYQIDHRKEKRSRRENMSKSSGKRRVKKKVTLSAYDNIISDDLDVALELAKSISKTKVEEAEQARQVHATHTRIVTKYVPESAKKKSGGRSSKSVVIQDTPSALKSKLANSKTKLKGTGIKLGVLDEEKDITEEKVDKDDDVDDEGNDHISDIQDADDEDVKTKSDKDDIYKYKIRVRKDDDEEMINAKVDDSDKGDEDC